jgi:hypothetical protein
MGTVLLRSRTSVALPISLVLGAMSCSRSSDLPSMPDVAADPSTASVADPIGDTFGLPGGLQWDITGLTVTRETDGITVRVDFENNVSLPLVADPNALVGLVELDLDQNRATGKLGYVDQLRKDGGATELGVDAALNLSQISEDSTLFVYDMGGNPTGKAKVTIGGRRITIRVPAVLIGNDDGYVDAAVIVGNQGRSPTDLAPQTGHLSLLPPVARE